MTLTLAQQDVADKTSPTRHMKDITETSELNLAGAIANTWQVTDVGSIDDAIGLLFEALPNDNLTQWSKDQQQLQYTAQAMVLNAIASGLDYAYKYQEKALDKIAVDLTEHQKSADGTEFWNGKAESLLERLAVTEHNSDAICQVLHAVKRRYQDSTGDAWKPWSPTVKVQVESATSNEVANVLARLKGKR